MTKPIFKGLYFSMPMAFEERSQVKRMILQNGGKIVHLARVDNKAQSRIMVHLGVDEDKCQDLGLTKFRTADSLLSLNFVYECVKAQELLDMDEFKFFDDEFSTESDETDAIQNKVVSTRRRVETNSKNPPPWTKSDYDILYKFAVEHAGGPFGSMFGEKLWQHAFTLEICDGRTPTSMREAFKRYMKQNPELKTELESTQSSRLALTPRKQKKNKRNRDTYDATSPDDLCAFVEYVAESNQLDVETVYWVAYQLNGDFLAIENVCLGTEKLHAKWNILEDEIVANNAREIEQANSLSQLSNTVRDLTKRQKLNLESLKKRVRFLVPSELEQ